MESQENEGLANHDSMARSEKAVRIDYRDAGSAAFANNMLVSRDESTVYVTFYQVTPPMIMIQSAADRKKAFEELDSVEGLPVIKIAFPIQKLKPLIKALQIQIDKSEGQTVEHGSPRRSKKTPKRD